MLHTIIQKNSYMDSVELMVLSKKLGSFDGVTEATVMMGTPANLEIMRKGGFESEEMKEAKPNDMVIAVKTDQESVVCAVMNAVRDALKGENTKAPEGGGKKAIRSWKAAGELDSSYNVCLISVPGEYAAEEAEEALNLGKHVMLFSDNVTEEDEKRLKELGNEKGLLVMGPDCGTSILHQVPLAFANEVPKGGIGIVGASGTGIQEVACAIRRFGGGISEAIGTGGRDLHEKIGGITMKNALSMLDADPNTSVITVVSKPPAPSVEEEFRGILAGLSKPCSVVFLGGKKEGVCGRVVYSTNLTDAARWAVRLSEHTVTELSETVIPDVNVRNPKIIGLYSGGTLAGEAAFLIREGMKLKGADEKEGYVLSAPECDILDLGDDLYTKGKPHPMMDSTLRKVKMDELTRDVKRPVILLMDVVLGYGAEKNPAAEIAEGIRSVREKKDAAGEDIVFLIHLLGTDQDPQNFKKQAEMLKQAGAFVYEGNVQAVEAALVLAGSSLPEMEPLKEREVVPVKLPKPSEAMMELLYGAPGVINVGLQGFAKDLKDGGRQVVQFEWRPAAGGDKTLKRAISFLDHYEFREGPYKNIEEANQAVLDRITAGLPHLVDVVPAYTAFEGFGRGKLLLHAGPPMEWEDMTHPMQGSCVGAVLFEEWADDEEQAWEMLRNHEVEFMPCHHAGFVGPMGGITSPHMPVLKVKNMAGQNYAYCTMNEGIGQVLRFGAYGPKVIERLRFMRDVLGPVLSKALHTLENGLNVNVMVSRAIAMGDEFHQRNIAASLVFLKEVAPLIVKLDIPEDDKYQVIRFLADTDQFFLNIMMASAKSVMDDAAAVTEGCVVTVMTRNGKDFGIRVSGMEKEWFTGPVNTPRGLYFTGFDESMANPDMGDSAITETFGVGGMAMIAAPAVTRFVGTGGFYDALAISDRMSEITIGHNGMFPIPTWDFKGICLGIDIRKVVASGITPVINTGIAHKTAGQGQIGAGTVNPPLECFQKALLAYAKRLGFKE